MAEKVEVVIKIPEVFYEALKQAEMMVSGQRSGRTLMSVIYNAVGNGTQLPKGHGKLIAEPTEEEIAKTIGGKNDFADCIRDCVKAVFDNAPAIIEADAEQEEQHEMSVSNKNDS